MKKKLYRLLAFFLIGNSIFSTNITTFAMDIPNEMVEESTTNIWQGTIEDQNRTYINETGEKKVGLVQIEGKTYYFNEEGIVQTGWHSIEGTAYYFSKDTGERYENCVEIIDGVEYHFDKEGICKKAEDNNAEQNDSENSVEVPELESESDTFEEKTEKVTIGWQDTENGRKYIISEDGTYAVGMQTIENKLYFFDESGILQIGWIDHNSEKYYAAADGRLYQNQFISFGSTYYYMGTNGAVQKNIIEVSGNLYYADEKTGVVKKTSGWIENQGKRYYAKDNGVLYRNQVITFGSTWYCMGMDGSIQTGIVEVNGKLYNADETSGKVIRKVQWVEKSGKRYYTNSDGVLYRNQVITFGSTWYCMGSDGSVQTGIVEANGKLYNVDETSGEVIRKAQWVEKSGKRYYTNSDGVLYRNQVITFGSTWYCMGSDGSLQTGIVEISGKLYNVDETSGKVIRKAQWVEKSGKRYYTNSDGVLYRNQVITFGSTWYCMGKDGSVQKGIVEVNGKLYYTDETTGQVIKKAQWIEQNGKRYFVTAEGKLYQNQIITFGNTWYYMGADGSVQKGIVSNKGTYYFADSESGIIRKQAGWIEYHGKKYYSQKTGVLYKNQFISFNETYYYCGSDAAIVTGKQVVGGVIYNFDSNGIMKKEGGWGEYNGNKYYKNPATGFPYKNQWVTFGQTWYYANVNGFMVSGWQTIRGYRYYFYPSTKVMARNTTIDGIRIGADGRVAFYSDRMAVFSTVSTNNANGTYNMKRALSSFNQVVIQPGQTLSFFGVAGPCGQAEGYLPAGVVGGVGYGGGICQASTTLYGAALRAGLTIVERRNHSVPSTYVPIGQDAMVDYGSSDLKIKNNYDFPVKLVTYSYGNTLYVEVWGMQPSWYDYVNIESWYTSGNSAVAYRKYIKNGNTVRVEQLPSSFYY